MDLRWKNEFESGTQNRAAIPLPARHPLSAGLPLKKASFASSALRLLTQLLAGTAGSVRLTNKEAVAKQICDSKWNEEIASKIRKCALE
ncbi:MAG: hypothetical protein ACLUDH_00650 [Faecalispora sporosphaeroides]|uniref:Uncharacterized protein n=1 Tax=Faecalispora sporosphaeroides TaxID=1549 RepID=A0A928Q3P7_9FIRM|nr:hypothetical protein [Faecalispora sporosphaeroides]MBE6833146.1 hypothetical protein [Faecalispora sporosphaeroides]